VTAYTVRGDVVADAEVGCPAVTHPLVVDAVHPDKATMTIAMTRDRFNVEPVIAISCRPLRLCRMNPREVQTVQLDVEVRRESHP